MLKRITLASYILLIIEFVVMLALYVFEYIEYGQFVTDSVYDYLFVYDFIIMFFNSIISFGLALKVEDSEENEEEQ